MQKYDNDGWNYIDELHKFVDGGMEGEEFINAVSGIVNRVCFYHFLSSHVPFDYVFVESNIKYSLVL